MTEIRVSGLHGATTDAIGASALLLRDEHPPTALPDHPDATDPQRVAFLRTLLADVENSIGDQAAVMALCKLAAAAGMWAERIDTADEPEPQPRQTRPAPKLTRTAHRPLTDADIVFTEDW